MTSGRERGPGTIHSGRFPLADQPKSPHRIEDILFRKEEPESNFILCDCGWRGSPEDFPVHRIECYLGHNPLHLVNLLA